jgi:hypothetical protein
LLTISSSIHELTLERRQTGTPSNRQPPAQFVLDFAYFFHKLTTALALALGDGIHGTGKEQPDRFVYMSFGGNWRKTEFGERLGNTYNSLELTYGDRNRTSSIGAELGRVDLPTNRDEMRRELFCCLWRETGCTFSVERSG